MADVLFGLDYGTGGVKGCLIDTQGEVLGYSFREYPLLSPYSGWSEHDPHLYWKNACDIFADCLSQAGVSREEIKGIAVSSALPCLVMIDKQGNPVTNAYTLMDRRAVKQVEWLREHIGEEKIFEISGNRLDDHPNFVKLMWVRENQPNVYKRLYKALTIEGYINYKLTGKATLAYQNAPFFAVAYNIVEKRFEEDILEKIGIDRSVLPELHYCNEVIGEVTPEAAKESGLTPGTPVAAGQADFVAGCIASGVIREGDVQCNLGTCGNFGIIHNDTNFMYEMIVMGFSVNPKDTYITIPTTTTGGQSLRFIRDTFGQMEQQAAKGLDVDAYDLLNLQAANIPPGSGGVIVLPFLMGERTPIWDVNARGVFFGLSLNHSKGNLVRATMEGVAYALYDSFRIMKESGRKINEPIIMHEGGAKSTLWRRIITDVFNTPTVLTKRRTGAPFGDAVLAGVATGLFKDYSMCKEWAEYIDRMEPSPENNALYMDYFKLYKNIYSHIKEDYKELARLRDDVWP